MTKQEQILNGLNNALQKTNSQIRLSLLDKIANYLPQALRADVRALQAEAFRRALASVKAIPHENDRLNTLSQLVFKLPSNVMVPPETLTIVKTLPSGIIRVNALTALAPHLSPTLLLEALDIARAFRYPNGEYCLALSLAAIAPRLPEPLREEVVLEALAAADSLSSEDFRDNVYRSNALISVSDILSGVLQAEVVQKALESARAIEEDWCRSMNLAQLVPKLPEALRAKVLQESFDAAKEEPEGWATSSALTSLVPKLPPELLPEAFNIVRDLRVEAHRFEINRLKLLITISARLPEVVPEVFATVKAIRPEDKYAEALVAIAPNLTSELLPEAFDLANNIQSKRHRLPVLIALSTPISKLPEEELLPLWQTIEDMMSQLSQREFAHHVMALSAVIHRIGGEEAVIEPLCSYE